MQCKRIIGIFSYLLGGNTFSTMLKDTLDKRIGDTFGMIKFSSNEIDIKLPLFVKQSATLSSSYITKQLKLDHRENIKLADLLVFQSYHLTRAFKKEIKTKPTILFLDSTYPLDRKRNLQATDNIVKKLIIHITYYLLAPYFKTIFSKIDYFFPRTEAVKRSLVEDYAISDDLASVTYFPLDASIEIAGSANNSTKFLFVGNDFKRKGGFTLLEAWERFNSDSSELIIVTNSSFTTACNSIPFVRAYSNLDHDKIMKLMGDCDVFLFPSFNDAMGIVLCESIAMGMAVIARQSVSQNELVINNYNGLLLDYDSNTSDWVDAMQYLNDDHNKLSSFKQNSLKLANKILSRSNFKQKVNSTIDRLLHDVECN